MSDEKMHDDDTERFNVTIDGGMLTQKAITALRREYKDENGAEWISVAINHFASLSEWEQGREVLRCHVSCLEDHLRRMRGVNLDNLTERERAEHKTKLRAWRDHSQKPSPNLTRWRTANLPAGCSRRMQSGQLQHERERAMQTRPASMYGARRNIRRGERHRIRARFWAIAMGGTNNQTKHLICRSRCAGGVGSAPLGAASILHVAAMSNDEREDLLDRFVVVERAIEACRERRMTIEARHRDLVTGTLADVYMFAWRHAERHRLVPALKDGLLAAGLWDLLHGDQDRLQRIIRVVEARHAEQYAVDLEAEEVFTRIMGQ